MKTGRVLIPILSFVLFLISFHPAGGAATEQISPAEIAGGPNKHCRVIKEPNPILLGGWKGVHQNFVPKFGYYRPEPINYYLKKSGSGYGLYFYRFKMEGSINWGDKYRGWRDWEINGDEIRSQTGVRIFTKDGKVYYSWKNDEPTELVRDERLGSGQ